MMPGRFFQEEGILVRSVGNGVGLPKMFFQIKLDYKVNTPAKKCRAIQNEEADMDWKDDEAYSYSFEEDWEEQGMAIPPRPDCLRSSQPEPQPVCEDEPQYSRSAADSTRHLMGGVNPGRIKQLKSLYQSVVRLNQERNDNSFVREARELARYKGEKARHVPFRSYWPTYDAMSQKQKEWYFYLRNQLREGKHPKTDLSYLFVYIYELINQVGAKDATDGLIQLCGVWNAYRAAYPILDKYLVLWVQDYVLIYAGGDFTTMMAYIPEKTLLSLFPDSLAGCFMENPDAGFTLDFISRFSDYRFYTGQLAQSNQGGFFLSLLPTVFQKINQCLLHENGKGIFGTYRPAHTSGKRRIAFQNAIYSGPVTSVCQDEMPYSTYPPLRSFFTSVIKETENRLREQAQIKGRLRGIQLDPKVLSVIQSLILNQLCQANAEEEKKKLQVDRDRIIRLIEESNLIRQRLLEGIDEITRGGRPDDSKLSMEPCFSRNNRDTEEDGEPAQLSFGPGESVEDQKPCVRTTGSCWVQEGTQNEPARQTGSQSSSNELTGAGLLKQSLTENQRQLLSFILQNGGEAGEGLISHAFPQLFLELEMDEINNQAMDALGDIILAREGGQWLIYDEYRLELEGVFA
jgi:hypothetical protein